MKYVKSNLEVVFLMGTRSGLITEDIRIGIIPIVHKISCIIEVS